MPPAKLKAALKDVDICVCGVNVTERERGKVGA
jgi:hypothetical protein